MSRVLAAPSAGQPISASFFAELLREVRANRPLAGKNVRTTRTPNGTHINAVGGAAEKHSPAAKIPGRFEILSIMADEPPESGGGGVSPAQSEEEEEEQTYTVTFANPYYDIGGKTYEMSSGSEEEDVSLENIKGGSIIYIKISAEGSGTGAELGTVMSLRELQSIQESDMSHYTVPLYKIQGGSVTCDFRTGPIAGMGEA